MPRCNAHGGLNAHNRESGGRDIEIHSPMVGTDCRVMPLVLALLQDYNADYAEICSTKNGGATCARIVLTGDLSHVPPSQSIWQNPPRPNWT
jgi:hypothetical protein